MKNDQEYAPPTDRKVVETSIASNWLDDFGVVHSISKDAPHTLDAIKEHFELISCFTEDRKRCFVTYPDLAKSTDAETRRFLNEILPQRMLAQAFVSQSNMMRMGLTIFFKLNKYVIPFKVFAEVEDAKRWLVTYDIP